MKPHDFAEEDLRKHLQNFLETSNPKVYFDSRILVFPGKGRNGTQENDLLERGTPASFHRLPTNHLSPKHTQKLRRYFANLVFFLRKFWKVECGCDPQDVETYISELLKQRSMDFWLCDVIVPGGGNLLISKFLDFTETEPNADSKEPLLDLVVSFLNALSAVDTDVWASFKNSKETTAGQSNATKMTLGRNLDHRKKVLKKEAKKRKRRFPTVEEMESNGRYIEFPILKAVSTYFKTERRPALLTSFKELVDLRNQGMMSAAEGKELDEYYKALTFIDIFVSCMSFKPSRTGFFEEMKLTEIAAACSDTTEGKQKYVYKTGKTSGTYGPDILFVTREVKEVVEARIEVLKLYFDEKVYSLPELFFCGKFQGGANIERALRVCLGNETETTLGIRKHFCGSVHPLVWKTADGTEHKGRWWPQNMIDVTTLRKMFISWAQSSEANLSAEERNGMGYFMKHSKKTQEEFYKVIKTTGLVQKKLQEVYYDGHGQKNEVRRLISEEMDRYNNDNFKKGNEYWVVDRFEGQPWKTWKGTFTGARTSNVSPFPTPPMKHKFTITLQPRLKPFAQGEGQSFLELSFKGRKELYSSELIYDSEVRLVFR